MAAVTTDKPVTWFGHMRRWVWRAVKAVLAVFLIVHLYAMLVWIVPVPGTANMAIRSLEGERLSYDWVPLNQISPHLVHAVIAAEDSGFCSHDGISVEDLRTAWADYKAKRRKRGASTITQQTAKNVFLWNGGGFVRKGAEAWMAVFIDNLWGKRRVIEVYLNVAEWGDGIFGAEAAAQVRFGKSAAELSRREAALLAAVLPSPKRYRVDPPGPYVRRQAGTYQARMRVVENEGLADCVFPRAD